MEGTAADGKKDDSKEGSIDSDLSGVDLLVDLRFSQEGRQGDHLKASFKPVLWMSQAFGSLSENVDCLSGEGLLLLRPKKSAGTDWGFSERYLFWKGLSQLGLLSSHVRQKCLVGLDPWGLCVADDLQRRCLTFEGMKGLQHCVLERDSSLWNSGTHERLWSAFEHARKLEWGYRQWMEESSDVLHSIEIGERLKAFSQVYGLPFQAFDEKDLEGMGANLLVAVGKGSRISPPRLYTVYYPGSKPRVKKPLCLLGKGITFDTGGLCLKAYDSQITQMKNDMGGASLAFHLFKGLVERQFPDPVVLVIPSCENAIGPESIKPGSVISSYSGQKVYLEHTDAEGRLILADALSYAEKTFDPQETFSFATLTASALRQYGPYVTPVHFLDSKWQRLLTEASLKWSEEFIFPRHLAPYDHVLSMPHRYLNNLARLPGVASIGCGSEIGGAFLKRFAKGPLIHTDLYASSWNWSYEYPGALGLGSTGAPFKSFFHAFLASAGLET